MNVNDPQPLTVGFWHYASKRSGIDPRTPEPCLNRLIDKEWFKTIQNIHSPSAMDLIPQHLVADILKLNFPY